MIKQILTIVILAGLTLTSCKKTASPKNQDATKTNTAKTTGINIQTGPISLDQLPTRIKDFVSNNFQGYKIEGAAHDPLCRGGDAIDVAITRKNSPNYSLIFLPDGTFVQKEEDMDINEAPPKVVEKIKSNFAGYKPSSQIEKLTLSDNGIQYLLDLTKDNMSKEVILDANGTVVCEN